MFVKLLAAFILIPLIELYLLLQVAKFTSVGATILLVILTGVLGTTLACRQGIRAVNRFHAALEQNRMPSHEIQDGLMIVVAGVMLLTPGLVTDSLGFLLLVPPFRDWLRGRIAQHYRHKFEVRVASIRPGDFVDGGPDAFEDQAWGRRIDDPRDTIDAEAVRRKP